MKYSMQKKGHVVVIELHDHLVGGPDASGESGVIFKSNISQDCGTDGMAGRRLGEGLRLRGAPALSPRA